MAVGRRTAVAAAFGLVILMGVVGSRSAGAQDAAAEAVVEQFYDQLIAVMREGEALGFDGRYHRIAPSLMQAFNLPIMTRIAVGPRWRSLAEGDQDLLIDRFTAFSIANYASNFASYSGERFEVTGTRAAPGGRTIVETRIVPAGDDPVAIDYLLEQFGGGWRIIDVFLSGTISELATRRSEFASVLRRDGVSGLVSMLDQKIRALRAG